MRSRILVKQAAALTAAALCGFGAAYLVVGDDTRTRTVTVVERTVIEQPTADPAVEATPAPTETPDVMPTSEPTREGPFLQVKVVDDLATACSDGLFAACDTRFGVVVERVIDDGPAAAAGIVRGEIITEVEGRPVTTVNELQQALAAADFGSRVRLRVRGFSDEGGASVLSTRSVTARLPE